MGRARIGCIDMQVNAEARRVPAAKRHPACPGLSVGIVRGAQQEDTQTSGPDYCPSRGRSAANRSSSGGGLSHVAGHKSNPSNRPVCRFGDHERHEWHRIIEERISDKRSSSRRHENEHANVVAA